MSGSNAVHRFSRGRSRRILMRPHLPSLRDGRRGRKGGRKLVRSDGGFHWRRQGRFAADNRRKNTDRGSNFRGKPCRDLTGRGCPDGRSGTHPAARSRGEPTRRRGARAANWTAPSVNSELVRAPGPKANWISPLRAASNPYAESRATNRRKDAGMRKYPRGNHTATSPCGTLADRPAARSQTFRDRGGDLLQPCPARTCVGASPTFPAIGDSGPL